MAFGALVRLIAQDEFLEGVFALPALIFIERHKQLRRFAIPPLAV